MTCTIVNHAFTRTRGIPRYHRVYTSSRRTISTVKQLCDWNLDSFRDNAFQPGLPASLPFTTTSILPASKKWFIHEGNSTFTLSQPPAKSELRTAFWAEHKTTMVPLELTSTSTSSSTTTQDQPQDSTFHRTYAPLKLLLSYLGNARTPTSQPLQQDHSIYLAQCDLTSLPQSLQDDLPTPHLVTSAGKGDIYSSSLWMGRPPTYTPLHRDPNPNLFIQLAGQKVVRLFPPELGDALFEDVQLRLSRAQQRGQTSSASFRGEEMMQGPEKAMLHDLVWGGGSDEDGLCAYAQEVRLGLGEALFVPKGWWHSVKGVGEGVTASVNWWFR